jgi:hypothetical protein
MPTPVISKKYVCSWKISLVSRASFLLVVVILVYNLIPNCTIFIPCINCSLTHSLTHSFTHSTLAGVSTLRRSPHRPSIYIACVSYLLICQRCGCEARLVMKRGRTFIDNNPTKRPRRHRDPSPSPPTTTTTTRTGGHTVPDSRDDHQQGSSSPTSTHHEQHTPSSSPVTPSTQPAHDKETPPLNDLTPCRSPSPSPSPSSSGSAVPFGRSNTVSSLSPTSSFNNNNNNNNHLPISKLGRSRSRGGSREEIRNIFAARPVCITRKGDRAENQDTYIADEFFTPEHIRSNLALWYHAIPLHLQRALSNTSVVTITPACSTTCPTTTAAHLHPHSHHSHATSATTTTTTTCTTTTTSTSSGSHSRSSSPTPPVAKAPATTPLAAPNGNDTRKIVLPVIPSTWAVRRSVALFGVFDGMATTLTHSLTHDSNWLLQHDLLSIRA